MPADPIEIEQLRDRLVRLDALHDAARARAARPPRLPPEAWRGPAYRAYLDAAAMLEAQLRQLAAELEVVVGVARVELARALA